ncbi:hypothetical protein [Pseudoxanthomonas sp. X-1]|uniref:hypothetical protein n=1 Tax=Pseudoxanthomonas sp. X-1 TaxID=2571115 RepID=UPI00110B787B|nr:hypothetical protein [Pseudoxanthomonas sp. X-1]TMN18477.1 hypothetical protein FF950_14435 [Pseudoxanthomonas sp. X-1]UAY76021.1 hypothetical protein LAJ50_07240 [Pseudoxanthomonas sp. X-1]
MTDPTAPVDQTPALPPAQPDPMKMQAREEADVKRWLDRYEAVGTFDEEARKQYAKDRRYARGDSGFEVDANLIGTNIDILEAHLYARDPDFDVVPGRAMRPPDAIALRDALDDQLQGSPEAIQAGAQAAAQAVAMGAPPDQAMIAGQAAQQAYIQQQISQQLTDMRKAYMRRQRDIKAFAESLEIVGERMWEDAQLKRRGRPLVRSGLTVGLGVIKASWQERTAPSPETQKQINDLQENLARARALQQQLIDGSPGLVTRAWDFAKGVFGDDQEATVVELERQLQAIRSQADPVVARGFVVDNVQPENFRVALGFTIANHLDAPWCGDHFYLDFDAALAAFGPRLAQFDNEGRAERVLGQATSYTPRKPVMVQTDSGSLTTPEATEADAFEKGSTAKTPKFVRVIEIWDATSSTVLTAIEGLRFWAKDPWTPVSTTRFYPYFVFTTSEVDGQRHPQSLVTRTMKLVDEYNRIGSAEAEHRRRIRPKMMFAAGQLAEPTVTKLAKGVTQEMVAVEVTNPQTPLANLFYPVPYAQIDPALYDRQRIINEIERIWGVQEALAGAVTQGKTATEADIQQQGFQARTGARRDQLESMLSDLARYTCEVCWAYLTVEDVQAIVGPNAFWPPYTKPGDLGQFVTVSIRAGSSGKPNTALERQAWSTLLPMLQQGIAQIGQLRQASPASIADSLEQLLRITAERSGERFDIDQLIPQGDSDPSAPPAMGMQPSPIPGVPSAQAAVPAQPMAQNPAPPQPAPL